jgi:putative tricarboxylic transport membrane protein
MKLDDRLTGLLFAAAGLAIAFYARTFPSVAGQAVGPGLFPTTIGVLLAGLGLALVLSGARHRSSSRVVFEEWARRPRMLVNMAAVLGAVVFYAVAAEPLGFFPTAIVVLIGLWTVLGLGRVWMPLAAVAAVLVMHYGFYTVLRVPLPWGVLREMAW